MLFYAGRVPLYNLIWPEYYIHVEGYNRVHTDAIKIAD